MKRKLRKNKSPKKNSLNKPLNSHELKKLAAAGELAKPIRHLPFPIEPFHP